MKKAKRDVGKLSDLVPADADQVLIGPVTLELKGPTFFVLTITRGGKVHMAACFTKDVSCEWMDETRGALVMSLVDRRPPLVMHSFDDVVRMMEMACIICPCERTIELLALAREG